MFFLDLGWHLNKMFWTSLMKIFVLKKITQKTPQSNIVFSHFLSLSLVLSVSLLNQKCFGSTFFLCLWTFFNSLSESANTEQI